MIEGVSLKELVSYSDERGFFREIARNSENTLEEGVGQISHSLVYQGVIKAWHYHNFQTQWNYVVNGLIRVALYDLRKNSSTYKELMVFLVGDNQPSIMYKFPPGVAHGYKCLNGPMNIIYITSGIYDLNDEGRISFDDKEIGYDWLELNIK